MQYKRYELKYYLNSIQTEILAQQLNKLLKVDPNGDERGEYRVRSLYFDSPDDECLFQKQSGMLHRKKIRLRTYGDLSSDTVKFEIKHKHGQLVNKESAVVPAEIAQQISNGSYHHLLDFSDPVLDRIYAIFAVRLYKPKVIVEYVRQAYLFSAFNVRITLDKHLSTNITHLDIFSPARFSMPVILEGKQILEVKFDGFFPLHLRHLLSSIKKERMAISKYTLARRFHKLNKWEDN